jgi:ADP-ribose pyrophosphatase YjhB (NUDIX family)
MNRNFPIRNTVRLVLLNEKDKLLLMHIDDPRTKSIGKKYGGSFWVTVGGQIEQNETVKDAAIRELFEETGIKDNEVTLGPIIWLRELDLILYGKSAHIKEQYIVARTNKSIVSPTQLTKDEMNIIKKLQWFSLQDIANSKETIYPQKLSALMKDIIVGNYPESPLKIS